MTFNFLGPGLTVNVEAKVKEQIILDSSGPKTFAPKHPSNLIEEFLTNFQRGYPYVPVCQLAKGIYLFK